MSAKRHPDVTLERGICVIVNVPCGFHARHHRHYQISGRLECGTPFLLDYAGGVTHWQCPLRLGDGARKKILGKVRKEIRHAVASPDYIVA